MEKKDLENFKNMFLARRQKLFQHTVEQIANDGGDEVDKIQENLLNDMVNKLSMRGRMEILKIDEALQRIKNETFGICGLCEEEISLPRLQATPLSNVCVACMDQQEKLSKQYR